MEKMGSKYKRAYFHKMQMEILILCKSSDYTFFRKKFSENILDGFEVIEQPLFFTLKTTKGHNSVKKSNGVTVLFLCTLSNDPLCFY